MPPPAAASAGHEGAVAQAAVAAVVAVGGDEQGDAGGLLIGFVLLIDLLSVAALPAQAALMIAVQGPPNVVRVQAAAHLHKQLAHFFLQRHGGDSVLHPFYVLVG